MVTGAASGFGRAIAEQLLERGFDVAMLDIDGDRVEQAAAELGAAHEGRTVLARRADVGSSADLEQVAAEVTDTFGRVDLLWANVGVQHFGAVEAIDDDVWRWVLDINVIGTVRTVRAFLPLLRSSAPARLAITASVNALAPAARLGAYQASKYAVVGVAETLRIELAPDQIGVTVVYPSGMMTRHLESSAAAKPGGLAGEVFSDADLTAMMESRPMTEADITTAEDAVARSIDSVLAGEPHVITHGALAEAVAEHHARIDAAVARLSQH